VNQPEGKKTEILCHLPYKAHNPVSDGGDPGSSFHETDPVCPACCREIFHLVSTKDFAVLFKERTGADSCFILPIFQVQMTQFILMTSGNEE